MSTPASPPSSPPKPLGWERDPQVLWERIRKRPSPLISVVFTVPLFLTYHMIVPWLDHSSRMDFFSKFVLLVVRGNKQAYIFITLGLTLALLLYTWWQLKMGKVADSPISRTLWESLGAGVLAVVMLGFFIHRTLPGESSVIAAQPILDRFVLALGSAFYEESIFRGILINGGVRLFTRYSKLTHPAWRWVELSGCMLVSSLLFAFAHFAEIRDDPFSGGVFAFRVAEGLFFAVVYAARGFAVAVYSHMLYNWVTSFLPI